MVMSYIFAGLLVISLACASLTGQGAALAAAIPQGAQSGVTLAIAMAGSICLWSGVGKLMEQAGFTRILSKFLAPALQRLFPSTKDDPVLAGYLSSNICANILGLGNAATPMGIRATKRMAQRCAPGWASEEMCRLIVLNTASIQLIPATVAAVRTSLGCNAPFDILPAVWVTSLCSAGVGLLVATLLGKVWHYD